MRKNVIILLMATLIAGSITTYMAEEPDYTGLTRVDISRIPHTTSELSVSGLKNEPKFTTSYDEEEKDEITVSADDANQVYDPNTNTVKITAVCDESAIFYIRKKEESADKAVAVNSVENDKVTLSFKENGIYTVKAVNKKGVGSNAYEIAVNSIPEIVPAKLTAFRIDIYEGKKAKVKLFHRRYEDMEITVGNKNVATATRYGNVYAKKRGRTKVCIKDKLTGKKYYCAIYVNSPFLENNKHKML